MKRKELARSAAEVLFAPDNEYLIDTIYESRHNISSFETKDLWDDALFVHIEHYFADTYLRACHATLKHLDWQKEVLGFQRGAEVDRHAVYLLERLGDD